MDVWSFLLGAAIGGWMGAWRASKFGYARGFVWGWMARHQGRGIPEQYSNYLLPIWNGISLVLSSAEKELLKDPKERAWRGLPPENI